MAPVNSGESLHTLIQAICHRNLAQARLICLVSRHFVCTDLWMDVVVMSFNQAACLQCLQLSLWCSVSPSLFAQWMMTVEIVLITWTSSEHQDLWHEHLKSKAIMLPACQSYQRFSSLQIWIEGNIHTYMCECSVGGTGTILSFTTFAFIWYKKPCMCNVYKPCIQKYPCH